VEPLLIVGIYNAGKQRLGEYTPTRMPKLGGGRANRYAKFLLEEVRPFLLGNYRVLSGAENTGIGGSSLGGLVSLYLGLRLPHVFGKIAALSPSVWWNQRVILRFADAAPVDPLPRIWLDIGTREGGRIVEDVERFRDILLGKGWRLGRDLHYQRVEGWRKTGIIRASVRGKSRAGEPSHHHSVRLLLRKRTGIHAHLQATGLHGVAFDGGKTSRC
jgi:predicted alpha/beta superfamily hydrolase